MDSSPRQRVVVLDVLRGAAVAGMIIVTSPGEWTAAYAPLRHADWNGWTLADMVFPTFLFAVGMAIGLSFPRDLSEPRARAKLWLRVARRTALLILLGLLLNAVYTVAVPGIPVYVGRPGLAFVRIPGILQRIALCYAAAVILVVVTARKAEGGRAGINLRAILAAIVILLAGYWLIMRFIPVPGYGPGRLDQEGNLAAHVDRALFGVQHLWPLGSVSWGSPVVYDPEGLLSSIPALTNALWGVLAGYAWRRSQSNLILKLAILGAGLMVAGLLFDPLFPINKKIWTSSFALLSSGFSFLALAFFAVALRSRVAKRLSTPLRVLGANAILGFAISVLLAKLSGAPWFRFGGQTVTAQAWGDAVARALIPDARLASLACALAILALIIALLWPLDRRAIHLRV